MAKAGMVHTKVRAGIVFAAVACSLAVIMMTFFGSGIAQGSDTNNNADTIGIGDNRSSRIATDTVDAEQKLSVENTSQQTSTDTVSDAETASSRTLSKADTRTISVKDPDPVIEIAAYDADDEDTVALAATVGELNPLPTAPRISPDTTGSGWQSGSASGYDVASSSTITASGRVFHDNCVTVAVPESQSYLLGQAIEIVYNGITVVATVTDTGGFEGYGRSLDLGGGIWKAFGASSCSDWGVRQVSYRYLG